MIKLDHNPIGDEGMNILAQSLGYNPDVALLSLTYCEIEPIGAEGLFEIIIYQNSKMITCLTQNENYKVALIRFKWNLIDILIDLT